MNLIAVNKDGNRIKGVNVVYLDHSGKPEQVVAYGKRHIFPQDGSMRLSTTFPDKNGRVICVGDRVKERIEYIQESHEYIIAYFGDAFCLVRDDRVIKNLTPELAATLEVVE